jgi:hypothetical protein
VGTDVFRFFFLVLVRFMTLIAIKFMHFRKKS